MKEVVNMQDTDSLHNKTKKIIRDFDLGHNALGFIGAIMMVGLMHA